MSESKSQKKSAWRDFEATISAQCESFFPGAKISRNERLMGRESDQFREVDIVIRQKIGLQEMLIVVDCKNYARPVEMKTMEAFCSLKNDVGANAGIVVSKFGFSKAATRVARNHQVTPYQFIEGGASAFPDWIWVPLVIDFWWLYPTSLRLKRPDGTYEELRWRDDFSLKGYGLDEKEEDEDLPLRSIIQTAWDLEKTKTEGDYKVDLKFTRGSQRLNYAMRIQYKSKRIHAFRRSKLLFSGFAEQGQKAAHSKAYTIQAAAPPRYLNPGSQPLGDNSGLGLIISTTLAQSTDRRAEGILKLFLNGILELQIKMTETFEWSLPKVTEAELFDGKMLRAGK